MHRAPRILALRALGLGDLLTTFPALRALRRRYPDATIELATRGDLAPLALTSRAVDHVIACGGLDRGLPRVAEPPYIAVNFHGRGPESTRLLVDTQPTRLFAFRHDDVPATSDGPPWHEDDHEVRRWCALLEWYGIDTDPTDLALMPPGSPITRDPALTIVHPGAKDPARRWPPDRFAAVARAEHGTGRRVVVTGSRAEQPLAQQVVTQAGLPAQSNVAGLLDVIELVRLVASAGLVVCGDTGIAHVATATATPSVVLFGPVEPERWGPPRLDRHRVLWAARRGDPHADVPFEGLLALDVPEVLLAIEGARSS